MDNQYTKEDVIQFTINILSGICVSALEAEEIGVPIGRAVKNLHVLQQMMEMEKNQRNTAQEEACETDGIDFGKDGDEDGNGEANAE